MTPISTRRASAVAAVALAGAVLAVTSATAQSAGGAPQAAPVTVVTVSQQDVTLTATLPGRVVASGVAGPLNAAVSGLGLGLFIAGSYLALNYAFARRPKALGFIDIGHAAGSAVVIAVALDLLN